MDQLTERTELPSKTHLAGVLAAGLAAAIGAGITSFAGIEGTLAGAIAGAVILAIGTELMIAPIGAIERRLVRAGFSAVRLRRLGLLRGVISTPGALFKLTRVLPRRAVLGVVTIAASGLLLGMGAISLLEVAQGRPISAATTSETRTGTTVG